MTSFLKALSCSWRNAYFRQLFFMMLCLFLFCRQKVEKTFSTFVLKRVQIIAIWLSSGTLFAWMPKEIQGWIGIQHAVLQMQGMIIRTLSSAAHRGPNKPPVFAWMMMSRIIHPCIGYSMPNIDILTDFFSFALFIVIEIRNQGHVAQYTDPWCFNLMVATLNLIYMPQSTMQLLSYHIFWNFNTIGEFLLFSVTTGTEGKCNQISCIWFYHRCPGHPFYAFDCR